MFESGAPLVEPHPLTEAYLGRQHVLDRMRLGAQYVVDAAMLEVRPDLWPEIHERLVAQLTSHVLADHIADDTYSKAFTFKAPRTTWQTFKQTHAGSWWLGWLVTRRPVVNRHEDVILTVHVKRHLTYPDAAIRHNGLGPFRILEQATTDWSRV